jgi:hypothetical protein
MSADLEQMVSSQLMRVRLDMQEHSHVLPSAIRSLACDLPCSPSVVVHYYLGPVYEIGRPIILQASKPSVEKLADLYERESAH